MGLHLCGPVKEFYLNLCLLLGPSKKKIIANGKKSILHAIEPLQGGLRQIIMVHVCICSIEMCSICTCMCTNSYMNS